MLPGSPLAASCPEPVARNGFSLARNSCRLSATSIPGSKLPACYFASFQLSWVPVRPFGSTTASRIAPVAAASLPLARCTSTTRFSLPRLPSPLPSGTFTSLGIEAFNRFRRQSARLPNPPDSLSLPAAGPFSITAADQRSWVATFPEACCSSNLLEPHSLCSRSRLASIIIVTNRPIFHMIYLYCF